MLPYTRREFAKLALAAGTLSALKIRGAETSMAPAGKPNSIVNGVQIGLNVPYSFGNNAMPGDEVLGDCVQLGISGVELRSQPVELFLGAPLALIAPPRRAAAAGEKGSKKAAPADKASASSTAEELRKWRATVDMNRTKAFRRQWEDAGVKIEIVKFDNIFRFADEELDYAFALAKTLGARAISCEISTKDDDLKRLGGFADKHQFPVGYHGHTTVSDENWENAFQFAKYNWANLDIGHYVAGFNRSPIEFMKKHHDRITHVHIKDKKMHLGPDTPFGEGDTPIVEVLRLIRDNHWPLQATIEFEYPVPKGSTRMAEIARAIKYCRDALA